MASRINLPHDIVVEILCRLAAKDLMRLRCLSKDYRDLIDSPDFVKHHISQSRKTYSIKHSLILRRQDKIYNYSLDLVSLETGQIKIKGSDILPSLQIESPAIIGSCNGLIALENDKVGIVICNPTTRKIHMIRTGPIDDMNYGFGYDPVSDDYKLVMIKDNFDGLPHIYNLKAGRWKDDHIYYNPSFHIYQGHFGGIRGGIDTRFPFHQGYFLGFNPYQLGFNPNPLFTRRRNSSGILVNNALYWMLNYAQRLVAFDLTSETYRDVPLPLLDQDYNYKGISELGGCLCLISQCDRDFDVWVLSEESGEPLWNKRLSFPMPDGATLEKPVAYSKCGHRILLWISYMSYIGIDYELGWYNHKGQKIDQELRMDTRGRFPDLHCYVSSLVSPAPTNYRPKRKAEQAARNEEAMD